MAVVTKNKKEPASSSKQSSNNLVDVNIRRKRDAKGNHPHIDIEHFDNKIVSVGLTHTEKKGKGHKNYPLKYNPLGGQDKSFMKKQGTVGHKKDYGDARKGKMDSNDYEKAKDIGKRAKVKYLEQNKKK